MSKVVSCEFFICFCVSYYNSHIVFRVETYASHEGNLYCKPHFRSLFAPKVVEDEAPRKYYIYFFNITHFTLDI